MSEGFPRTIDALTRYCAVYGHPIRHSASPAMQNAGMAALELNWRYLAFDVHPDHLAAALEGARRMHFIGINLTVPHKLLAVEMMDALDDSARQWGAVNTVRFEGRTGEGEWQPLAAIPDEALADGLSEIRSQGFNTDADAIIRSLEEDLGVKPAESRIFLLGAGGAGRVAALKLAESGVPELVLHNRTVSRAEAVAREIADRFPQVTVEVGYPSGEVDLVVNATSLGLRSGDPLPLDTARFDLKKTRYVYDMIYQPAETPLLAAAREAGCQVANGLGMLLYQGARALEIWSGRKVPVDRMREALQRHIYGH